MASAVTRFPTGRLRLSRIVVFSDLQHADSHEIHIGVVAEVVLPTLRAIGTAVRSELPPHEQKLLGPILRRHMEKPIEHLWPEILEVFKGSAPGQALESLAERHASSLSVLAPRKLEVPRQWLIEKDEKRLSSLVKARIKVSLIDAYFELLFPPRGSNIAEPATKERVARLAA